MDCSSFYCMYIAICTQWNSRPSWKCPMHSSTLTNVSEKEIPERFIILASPTLPSFEKVLWKSTFREKFYWLIAIVLQRNVSNSVTAGEKVCGLYFTIIMAEQRTCGLLCATFVLQLPRVIFNDRQYKVRRACIEPAWTLRVRQKRKRQRFRSRRRRHRRSRRRNGREGNWRKSFIGSSVL